MTASDARAEIEDLVLRILRRDDAHERSLFRYLGYDWTGDRGWYFWPKERAGAYALKEQNSARLGTDLKTVFSLYYYPDIEEDASADFSLQEQMVRSSDLFARSGPELTACCELHARPCAEAFADLANGTGIPTLEARRSLCPSLFCVGCLTFEWRRDRLCACSVEAAVRSRTFAFRDVVLPDASAGGETLVLEARQLDRDVPCFDLAYSFARMLLTDAELPFTEEFGNGVSGPDGIGRSLFRFSTEAG